MKEQFEKLAELHNEISKIYLQLSGTTDRLDVADRVINSLQLASRKPYQKMPEIETKAPSGEQTALVADTETASENSENSEAAAKPEPKKRGRKPKAQVEKTEQPDEEKKLQPKKTKVASKPRSSEESDVVEKPHLTADMLRELTQKPFAEAKKVSAEALQKTIGKIKVIIEEITGEPTIQSFGDDQKLIQRGLDALSVYIESDFKSDLENWTPEAQTEDDDLEL